jgi:hypothetical protein
MSLGVVPLAFLVLRPVRHGFYADDICQRDRSEQNRRSIASHC